jgi:hypothetical protein
MPLYVYQHEESGEVREIFQGMNEEHVYRGEDGSENGWKRVYTVPQASFDTKVDPNDAKSFIDRTANKKGTYGDIQDHSAELSEMRAQQHNGVDPIKKKYFEDYSSARNGAKHPDELKSQTKFEGINVDWS